MVNDLKDFSMVKPSILFLIKKLKALLKEMETGLKGKGLNGYKYIKRNH